MKEYEIYRVSGIPELVTIIEAMSYQEAVRKARRMGYGGEAFAIKEVEEDWR